MPKKIFASSWLALFLSLLVLGLQVAEAAAQTATQGQWSTVLDPNNPTQPLLAPINPIHAALLSNGKLLILAGSGNCSPSQWGCPGYPNTSYAGPYGPSNGSGAALYDPIARSFTQFSVSWDMFCSSMVLLPDGRALIVGGTKQYEPFEGASNTSIFNPSTNTFADAFPPSPYAMAQGRWYPTVTTLGDGRAMAFSGLDGSGNINKEVEIYAVATGWSSPQVASWTPELYPRMHLLPNGKVFNSGPNAASYLFDPSTKAWSYVTYENYPWRGYGTSVLLPLTPANNYDPKVMIMGGNNPATATTEIIDLGAVNPTWQYGPSMSQPRIEMNAVILPTGKVLALGGSTYDETATAANPASLNADLYDPATNTFSSAGANAYPRLYHSMALLLPDATVWVAGGNPSWGTYEPHTEIYKPAYLFQSNGAPAIQPSISSVSSPSVTWGQQFTVQSPNAASISSVVLVRNGAVTHSFNADQRLVGMSFNYGRKRLNVTAPPNQNIAPPGYYLLFLVNNSGVPSVASSIKLQ
jgi:Domain of unknown function (DUF1929)/Glyoxal oxidase N-terminus